MATFNAAIQYASEKLGFVNGFRSQQCAALSSFLKGQDLFVSLPTGYGKSVVFQAAPLCVDFFRGCVTQSRHDHHMAIIVMPLRSLIADQIRRAQELHIDAVDVTGGLTDGIRENISSAKYSLIFTSPESLLGDVGHELLSMSAMKEQVCGFFIDESHCVSKW